MNVDHLCLYCMREKKSNNNYCEYCGHLNDDCAHIPGQLPFLTILHGRYLTGRVLLNAGWRMVYLAVDLTNEKRVAIHELFIPNIMYRQGDQVVLSDQSYAEYVKFDKYKKELLHCADHLQIIKNREGIVTPLDCFEENDTAYIVLEFLEGEYLTSYLRKRGEYISPQEAFLLLDPVLKTLTEINKKNMVHTNISPNQIMILDDGRRKLLGSFDQIVTYDSKLPFLINSGYSSPEEYIIHIKKGPWTNVYSITAVFYRCITGKNPIDSLKRLENDYLELTTSSGSSLPQKLKRVIKKGLSLNHIDRYPDVESLYKDLKEYLSL